MENVRPQPPDDLADEALLEWHRTCDELVALGTLHTADRATLVLHCRTWAAAQEAWRAVAKAGSVTTYINDNTGPSAYFKAATTATKLDRQLLADLGLTAKTRAARAPAPAPKALNF